MAQMLTIFYDRAKNIVRQYFEKASFLVLLKVVIVGLPSPKQALIFIYLQYKPFEHTLTKGEIARYEHNFSFFSTVFYTPFEKLSAILIQFEIVVCKFYQIGRV